MVRCEFVTVYSEWTCNRRLRQAVNGFTRYRRVLKYTLLSHLPGNRGQQYRRKLTRVFQLIRFEKAIEVSQRKICIDLGANLGDYTKKMALRARQVIAFEPDPWTCDELRRNLDHLENVRIENAAAGVSDSPVFLFRHKKFIENPASRSQSSSVLAGGDYLNTEEGIEVRQVDFVKYLEELDEDIGVLKIDIEGAEVDLLEALFDRPDILARIDHIFAETHEEWIPRLAARTKALRRRAEGIVHPKIDLEWP